MKVVPCPMLIFLSIISSLVFSLVYTAQLIARYALMANSHQVASSFFPEKSSGSPAFSSTSSSISLSSLCGNNRMLGPSIKVNHSCRGAEGIGGGEEPKGLVWWIRGAGEGRVRDCGIERIAEKS